MNHIQLNKVSNKRLRPDKSNYHSKDYFMNDYAKKQKLDEIVDLWGGDLNLDEDIMQQIESQALSQYPEPALDLPKSQNYINDYSQVPDISNTNYQSKYKALEQELLMKKGEVTNLRLEMKNKNNEYKTQLDQRDKIIEDLKKQLCGKQSEIDFQKVEKMSQVCRTPKQQNTVNSSFHERFAFSSPKNVTKDIKVLNLGNQIHKGDILFKLLNPVLPSTSKMENIFRIRYASKENGVDNILPGINSTEQEFVVHLGISLLQLCRFASFEIKTATDLIKQIIGESNELLFSFHERLLEKTIKKCKSSNVKLERTKDTSEFVDKLSYLLKNTKLFTNEKGVAVRQTITMLTILLQIEPKIVNLLIDSFPLDGSNCNCDCIQKFHDDLDENMHNEIRPSTSKSNPNNSNSNKAIVDQLLFARNDSIFDVFDVLCKIVKNVTIRSKSSKYEGVFCSVLYFFSVLCSFNSNIIQIRHRELMFDSIKNILFSLPGFIVIQYMIEFLSNAVHCNFSNTLCCRSANETFYENFKGFFFTKETCVLQVLCAYIELSNKSVGFIGEFTSWIVKMTAIPNHVRWMENTTNNTLCECLPTIEQITVKIMLHCIDNYKDIRTSSSDKTLLKSFLKRSVSIFKQFRWRDINFESHIAICRNEYKILLHNLREIFQDELITKFVSEELETLPDDKKNDLTSETKTDIVDLMLSFSLFSEDECL